MRARRQGDLARCVKKLAEELDKAEGRAPRRQRRPADALRRPQRRPARPAARARTRSRRPSCRGAGSTRRGRRRRPGTSRSTCRAAGSTTRSATPRRLLRRTRRRSSTRIIAHARREAGADRSREPHACAMCCCTSGALGGGAGRPLRAVLLPHRRRGAPQKRARSPAARIRTATRRSLDVLGALQKFAGVRPHAGGLRRSARAPAAAALLDLVLAQGRRRAGSRSRSTPCATSSTRAGGSASPRPSAPSASRRARPAARLRPEGARLRACRQDPAKPVIMVGPGTGRRAVPRLPARARRRRSARPQLAVLRPPAPGHATSSTATSCTR